jgi:tRNA(Ser,Leu) C12 N-acetylase TAN1
MVIICEADARSIPTSGSDEYSASKAASVEHLVRRLQRQTDSGIQVDTWNAIVTARGDHWQDARRALRALGRVRRTGFYNVLTMEVNEPQSFVAQIEQLSAEHPALVESVGSVFAATRCFDFSNVAEFESKAREAALEWVPQLAGKRFHVRMHRRGRKGMLASPREERTVADALLDAIRETGNPAHISFDDPDAIVLIETVSGRAGMALYTREDYRRHPLLAAY